MLNKCEWKRLGLYLLFTFGLCWIPLFILYCTVGYKEWFSTVVAITMSAPALASILTRIITKEAWKDCKLHLNLKKNVLYYAISFIIPVIFGISIAIYINTVYGDWNWKEIESHGTFIENMTIILNTYISPIFFFTFICLGEEFGWRAYMNQKLEKQFGIVGTSIIGGIIWGIWYLPLIVNGYKLGKDYPGFPFLGLVLICLSCILSGMILMWLTKKTNSIYPAAILRSLLYLGMYNIGFIFVSGVSVKMQMNIKFFQVINIMLIPEAMIGIVCLVMMLRDKKMLIQ